MCSQLSYCPTFQERVTFSWYLFYLVFRGLCGALPELYAIIKTEEQLRGDQRYLIPESRQEKELGVWGELMPLAVFSMCVYYISSSSHLNNLVVFGLHG